MAVHRVPAIEIGTCATRAERRAATDRIAITGITMFLRECEMVRKHECTHGKSGSSRGCDRSAALATGPVQTVLTLQLAVSLPDLAMSSAKNYAIFPTHAHDRTHTTLCIRSIQLATRCGLTASSDPHACHASFGIYAILGRPAAKWGEESGGEESGAEGREAGAEGVGTSART